MSRQRQDFRVVLRVVLRVILRVILRVVLVDLGVLPLDLRGKQARWRPEFRGSAT